MTYCVLSIAGTDPTGGAGIQADLKTIAALGGYGLSVITAVVAQNSSHVLNTALMTPEMVQEQLQAIVEEMSVHAIKIGMLGDARIIETVATYCASVKALPVVLDPVMKASAGQDLLKVASLSVMLSDLLPNVTMITPNLAEAATLLGQEEARTLDAMEHQARALQKKVSWVLLKGGHFPDESCSPDVLVGPDYVRWYQQERLLTFHGRGTGCTLSSALAFYMIHHDVPEAVERARHFVYRALQTAGQLNLVQERGPLNHFHWY
ncbi:bifunctional hydroxymethylpyrimidine kinase/phosphomethylpyrimidine kinase [Saccharibacter sp. 17.LH.SD]|uniref:bifunctional hydroxymethylpyrimidine kinase/phosphomethylpyrimidine kinase n=1 Tax=Saccharibacter sp. 17.LH.SD TaxID=2689393 RepID=UPI00136C7546|nr:bifunctional hydroxymethylpyrimidine kinase/phosphomethylpyrimidine kinase [Saccharibacter sp. 17.LH.SD]MXV44459.1 bifunctional hydroxymethylpyrimidine kinase/phosphomethylpyrimidine kinase [Saccharibacter sp. 17.LH.SD]